MAGSAVTERGMVDPAMPGLKDAARHHVGIALGVAVDRVGDQS
jgi:hypothetical protein